MKKTIILLISLIFNILLWLKLLSWYSLFSHINTPYFALDKIPEHFDTPQIKLTLLIFLLLSLIYIVNFVLLKSIELQSYSLFLLFIPLIIGIFIYPIGALDIFNYIAESKLFFVYQANPYITTFNTFTSDLLNHYAIFLNVPLAYGPFWLLSTGFISLFSPYSSILLSVILFKIFNLFVLLACAYMVYQLSSSPKQKIASLYLIIANPFIIFEVMVNGHNDILFTFLLLATIFCLHKKSWLSVPLFVLSVATKYFSLVLLPVMFFSTKRFFKLSDYIKSLFLSLFLISILYLPFWSSGKLLQYLPLGIKQAQDLNTYSVFSLIRENLRLHNISFQTTNQVLILFIITIIAFSIFIAYRLRQDIKSTFSIPFTLLGLILILSAFQPWYLIPVIVIFCINSHTSSLFYVFISSLCALTFYPLSVWLWFNSGFAVSVIHLYSSIFFFLPVLLYFIINLFTTKHYE